MYKKKEGNPTLDIRPLEVSDKYRKRTSVKKVVGRVNQIVLSAFEEIAPKYEREGSDLYGWIEITAENKKSSDEFVCTSELWRCYEEHNAFGSGFIDVNDSYVFHLPVGNMIIMFYLAFRFSNLPDNYTGPIRDFFWEMNDRIIFCAMQSIPTGTRYLDRLAEEAKRRTARSLIWKHSPIIFETDIEASLFAKRYGFISASEQEIFFKVLRDLRKNGLRI